MWRNSVFVDDKSTSTLQLLLVQPTFLLIFLSRLLVLGGLVKVFDKVRDFIVILFSGLSGCFQSSSTSNVAGKPLEMSEALGSELVKDPRQHLSDLFIFSVTSNSECVGLKTRLDLGIVKIDHCSVILDHVDLLNARDVVD